MTHVHAPVLKTREEIAAKARDIHPVQFAARTLLTTILFIFTSIGWLAGAAWFVLVFSVLWAAHHLSWCGQAARYGYHKGARHQLVPDKE